MCKEGSKFTVKNDHECNLGKWVDSNEDKDFANINLFLTRLLQKPNMEYIHTKCTTIFLSHKFFRKKIQSFLLC